MKSISKYVFLLTLSFLFTVGTFPLTAQTSPSQFRKPKIQNGTAAQTQKQTLQQQNAKRSAAERASQGQTATLSKAQQRQALLNESAPGRPQQRAVQQHHTQKRSNTGAKKPAARKIRERKSENPVRFAFAPKPQTQREIEDESSWDDQPSPMAIVSTLLTWEIAPELIAWHVLQRKKAEYERTLAARGELPAREHHSEYSDMLGRMQFSFADHSRSGEFDYDPSNEYEDPSNSSILAQFLTGRKNGEMREWKENLTHLAGQTQQGIQEQIEQELFPLQYMHPLPTPNEILTAQNPYRNPVYPDPNLLHRAAENAPVPIQNLNRIKNAAVTGDSPIRTPVMIANAEAERFVDDHFPTGQAASAGYRGIRQVSAEIPAPAPKSLPVLQSNEPVSRSGQIRVYSETDENGWSPAE